MNGNILRHWYMEYKDAVADCNEFYATEGKQFLQADQVARTFVLDVLGLCLYAAQADDEISEAERDRIYQTLDYLSASITEDELTKAEKAVQKMGCVAPIGWWAFIIRAEDRIRVSDVAEETKMQEQEYLEAVLEMYADLMSSVADELTPVTRMVIEAVLRQCCDVAAKRLQMTLGFSSAIMDILE